MQIQQLSFADMMAKYVEKTPSLPAVMKSEVLISEPSYTSYSEVSDTKTSEKKWLLVILGIALLGICAWVVYTQKEKIKKWYVENFELQYEEDDLTLSK